MMKKFSRSFVCTAATLSFLYVLVGSRPQRADAQTNRRPIILGKKLTPADYTSISLTILTKDNTAAFRAFRWKEILQKQGISFRIRSKIRSDKVGVRESKRGRFRTVTVIGELDRQGRLFFGDRVYSRNDAGKLLEWIRELKTYGALGAPDGKPMWGLTKSQFGEVFRALSKPVKGEVKGQSLKTALAKLGLPKEYPLRYSIAGQRAADLTATVRKSVEKHSLGTALALILRDAGLGFRPLRTPEGSLELVIDPFTEDKLAWPAGWELKQSRLKTAPRMFEPGPVDVKKVKLVDIFRAVEATIGVPVHVDYHAAARKNIDVSKLVVSFGPRKVSPSVLLRDLCALHRLSRELKIDEKGQPFVWITVFVPKPIESQR